MNANRSLEKYCMHTLLLFLHSFSRHTWQNIITNTGDITFVTS